MDRRSEFVSICIPAYNGKKYISAAIESAIRQTHENTEILVVDDCSTDDTSDIAAEYRRFDDRIRLIANTVNLGLVGNWNRCISLAEGRWIKFLFQDDVLAPQCVETMLAAGEEGWPFVTCDRDFIFDESISENLRSLYARNRIRNRAAFDGTDGLSAVNFSLLMLDGLHENFVGEPTCTLIRADWLARVGQFNPAVRQLCDVEYWVRLGCNVGVRYVPQQLASFRVHADSATARNMQESGNFTDSLDKLAIAAAAAHAPECGSLREVARTQRASSLLDSFRTRRRNCYTWAIENAAKVVGSNSVMERYEEFILACPEARVGKLQRIRHQATRLWFRHIRQLGR